MTIRIHWSKI